MHSMECGLLLQTLWRNVVHIYVYVSLLGTSVAPAKRLNWSRCQSICVCYLWSSLSPLLVALRYVMYFRFCQWRHVCTYWPGINDMLTAWTQWLGRWRHGLGIYILTLTRLRAAPARGESDVCLLGTSVNPAKMDETTEMSSLPCVISRETCDTWSIQKQIDPLLDVLSLFIYIFVFDWQKNTRSWYISHFSDAPHILSDGNRTFPGMMTE